MSEEPEKKDFLTSIMDGAQEFVDGVVDQIQGTIDSVLGKEREEGEEPEGISKIIKDIRKGIRELLGIEEGEEGEGEEGEEKGILKIIKDIRKNIRETLGLEGEGGFDLEKSIRDIRNQIREILGMEPISEPEEPII